MHLTIKDSGTLAVLTLEGQLSQHNADEMRTYLHHALHYACRLIVNCERLTGVDVSCLQALCSAYRASQKMSKEFALAGSQVEMFAQAVKASDYEHCIGCGLDCVRGCLWRIL